MKARTVVIGGGVVGLSTALHVARKTDPLREPVVLLESGVIGEGSDALSGAILSQYAERPDQGGMARDSLRFYRALEERTARSLGILPSGVLRLVGDAGGEQPGAAVELLRGLGVDIEQADARRMRELFPGISVADDEVGTWEPGGGCLDPQRCLDVLATLARDAGAVIRQGTRALEVLVDEGRVCGVRTAEGEIRCESVVVASGSATHALLRPLGIELPLDFLRSDHCYMAGCDEKGEGALDAAALAAGPEASGATGYFPGGFIDDGGTPELHEDEGDEPGTVAAHPVLIDPGQGFYVRCDPLNARVTVGRRGGDGYPEVSEPAAFDAALDREFLGWAREVLEHRMPGYADVHEIGAGARLVTRAQDREPVLGRFAAVEGLFTACALAGRAFLLAPSVGEGMAQLILGEPNSAFETERYSPSRFGL